MQIRVRHETAYRYDLPLKHGVMVLRLSPAEGPDQRVHEWKVDAPGKLAPFRDHHGNRSMSLAIAGAPDAVTVVASGVLETSETHGIRPPEGWELPPGVYLRESPFTGPDVRLIEFAEKHRSRLEADRLKGLHRLMSDVHEAIDYREGETAVSTTAAEALAAERGVCQDHAHVFIACCRHLGVPARYVSGYLALADGGEGLHGAGHAWAEALVDEVGWVSFDPANGVSASEHYARLAVGLDYSDAGPLRGMRTGGGGEALEVQVRIQGQG